MPNSQEGTNNLEFVESKFREACSSPPHSTALKITHIFKGVWWQLLTKWLVETVCLKAYFEGKGW